MPSFKHLLLYVYIFIVTVAVIWGSVEVFKFTKVFTQASVPQINATEASQLTMEEDRMLVEGQQLSLQGNHEAALEIFQRLLDKGRRNNNQLDQIVILNYIAQIYQNQGQFSKALAVYQQTLQSATLLGEKFGKALTLHNIGILYQMRGEYPESLTYFKQARETLNETLLTDWERKISQGRLLGNIAFSYMHQGDYKSALQNFNQSLSIFEQLQERDSIATTLAGIAQTHDAMGNDTEAVNFYQDGLQIVREVGNRFAEGKFLDSLGGVYFEQGQYAKAIETLNQALDVSHSVGDRIGEMTTLNNLGLLYQQIGQVGKANRLFEQVWDMADEMGLQTGKAQALNNLGSVYRLIGEVLKLQSFNDKSKEAYDKALNFWNQSLAIREQIGDQAGQCRIHNNIGRFYADSEEYSKARQALQVAQQICSRIGNKQGEGIALGNLGVVYASLGQPDIARNSFQKALQIQRQVGDRLGEGMTLHSIGAMALFADNPGATEQPLRESIKISEQLRSGLDDANQITLFEKQQQTYRLLEQSLVQQGKVEAALEIAERGRGRVMLDSLEKQLSPVNQQTQVSNLLAKPPTLEQIRKTAQQVNATLVVYSIAEPSKLYIYVVRPAGTVTLRQVNLRAVEQAVLDDAYLSASRSQDITRTSQALDTLVRQVRENVERGSQQANLERSAGSSDLLARNNTTAELQQPYQLLIQPIADLLLDDPDASVILIPQGNLWKLPWAALQDSDGTYLVEQHTIAMAPSIQLLEIAHQQSQQRRGQGALVVGNPGGDLAYAQVEASEIAKLLDSEPLIRDAATKSAVVRRMPDVQFIHIAAHGSEGYTGDAATDPTAVGHIELAKPNLFGRFFSLFSSNVPEDPSEIQNEGQLTSSEILGMSLKADLAVLSACQTGLGVITNDGVIGLSRSFLIAGVPSTVVTGWNVFDPSTQMLMQSFYQNLHSQNLQKTGDRARALRQAMLSTMHRYPRPYFWAAFYLMGQP